MAGPWDKYAAQSAPAAASATPWDKYQAQQSEPSPSAYTGKILPISVDQQGHNHFDANAGLLGSVIRAFTAPGDAYNGSLQVLGPDGNVTQEAIDRGTDFAGAFSPMNPAVRAGEAVIPGVAGSFKQASVNVPTVAELKAVGGAGYDALRGLNAQYSAQHVADLAARTQQKLEDDGFNAITAPKTFQNLQSLQSPPPNGFASSSNLETARRTFGKIGQDYNNPADQTAGKTVRGAIDDFVMSPPEGSILPGSENAAAQAGQIVTDARGNIAASKRSGAISEIQDAADLRSAAANSGQNFGNTLRQKVAGLLLDPRKISGFNDAERQALEGVVRGSMPANATRFAGNMLGGGGGLGASAAIGVTGLGASTLTGNPYAAAVGLAAPIAGAISKKVSNALTERALNSADETIRARSPLYQSLLNDAGSVPDTPDITNAIARALLLQQGPQTNGGGGGF